jgi:ubiquinone/menaquinone biosynthesis C-methylase UbiE
MIDSGRMMSAGIRTGPATLRGPRASSGPAGRRDPSCLTLSDLDLPRAWPDDIFRRIGAFFRFLRTLLFGGRKVELPSNLPGGAELPEYLLREFHRMPNGYYSYMLVDGYERGFERAMLGQVGKVRTWIAQQLRDCQSVLEIGCGSGKLSGAVAAAGVPEVWGIDSSPYQLILALRGFPGVKFVHGVAERTPFADGRFDGVAVCFVFHELPTDVQDAVLAEMHRVLRPGGRIVISEPSREQLHNRSLLSLWRRHGWRGVYFRVLATFVTEPYVEEWHARDIAAWAAEHRFAVEMQECAVPFNRIVLRRL